MRLDDRIDRPSHRKTSRFSLGFSPALPKYSTLSPYELTKPCPRARGCYATTCPGDQLFCAHRSQFHLSLARLGKTALTAVERRWLAPKNAYGGKQLANHQVPNPVFLYEQTQLMDNATWDDLAEFLNVQQIENQVYHDSLPPWPRWGKRGQIDICNAQFDDLRALLMGIAYEMSVWLVEFFVPVARDPTRPDVVIANIDQFVARVLAYRQDPCNRLVRDDGDGVYRLPTNETRISNA